MWRHLCPEGARGPDRLHHQRRAHGELGRPRDAGVLPAAPGSPTGRSTSRAGVWSGPGRSRRGALGRAPRAEGAPDSLRARARARAGCAPRPLARRAAAGRGPARPARAHDRLRAPLRDLQARGPDPVRPGPAARARRRPRAADADPLRRQGAPRRSRGAGGDPAAVRADAGRVPRQDGLPRGLRHRGRPRARPGLRRLAQHAAPAARGQRHVGPEGPDQRRGQPEHPRRLVGRGLPRRQRLGDRRLDLSPDDGSAGSRGRRVALPRARGRGGAALLRARADGGLPARLGQDHEGLDRVDGAAFSAYRMVRDYVVGSYLPAAEAGKG